MFTRIRRVPFALLLFAGITLCGCLSSGNLVLQLQDEVGRLHHERNVLRGRLFSVRGQLAATQQDLRLGGGELATERARTELQSRLRDVGIRVSANANGALVVTLVNSILFPSGQARLKPSAMSALKKVAREIKGQFATHTIRVEGHTDNQPILRSKVHKDNWELSGARALAVLRHLIDEGALPPHRLYAAGFGMFRPVKPNSSPAGRAANRRVDIVILPKIKVERHTLEDLARR